MYRYFLSMTCFDKTVNFENYQDEVNSCFEDFNFAWSRNRKNIKLISIKRNHIILQLESDIILNKPGRALQMLSTRLIKLIPINKYGNNQYFAMKEIKPYECISEVKTTISDKECFNIITDIFFSKDDRWNKLKEYVTKL